MARNLNGFTAYRSRTSKGWTYIYVDLTRIRRQEIQDLPHGNIDNFSIITQKKFRCKCFFDFITELFYSGFLDLVTASPDIHLLRFFY